MCRICYAAQQQTLQRKVLTLHLHMQPAELTCFGARRPTFAAALNERPCSPLHLARRWQRAQSCVKLLHCRGRERPFAEAR